MSTLDEFELFSQVLEYDPNTGLVTWKISPRAQYKIGDPAGCIGVQGYVIIGYKYRYMKAHRLAFFIMTGREPVGHIDHIDGVRHNNIWSNLRECTASENCQNVCIRKDNKSGYPGVMWDQGSGKWRAAIRHLGKAFHLGFHDTKEDAYAAYLAGKAKHHRFAPQGYNLPPIHRMLKTAPAELEDA